MVEAVATEPVLKTQVDCDRLSRQITSELRTLGVKGRPLTTPLITFLDEIRRNAGVAALGIIYGKDRESTPTMSMYALTTRYIDLHSAEQASLMDQVRQSTLKLSDLLKPNVDGIFLEFVDKRSCPDLVRFDQAMNMWMQERTEGKILACPQIHH